MGDIFPPPTLPPPSHSSPKSAPFLYYGLAIVAIAAVVLVVYNLIIVRYCANHGLIRQSERRIQNSEPSSSQSFDNPSIRLVSSFKYKRAKGELGEYECSICLSVLEEGEEVRRMPRCEHAFHAPCIDMWLYSHVNCPLCRAPLESSIFP